MPVLWQPNYLKFLNLFKELYSRCNAHPKVSSKSASQLQPLPFPGGFIYLQKMSKQLIVIIP